MGAYDGPELVKRQANFTPLSPVSMLRRTERVFPEVTAQIQVRQVFPALPEASRRCLQAGHQFSDSFNKKIKGYKS